MCNQEERSTGIKKKKNTSIKKKKNTGIKKNKNTRSRCPINNRRSGAGGKNEKMGVAKREHKKTGIEMHNFWRKACFRLVHGNACFHELFGDFQQIVRLA